jgi:hypothetical protein
VKSHSLVFTIGSVKFLVFVFVFCSSRVILENKICSLLEANPQFFLINRTSALFEGEIRCPDLRAPVKLEFQYRIASTLP